MLKSFPELGVTLESRLVDDTPLHHFKKANTPLTIYVAFDFGSIHGSIPGISHFLEHIFFTGTEKFQTKKAFTEYVRSRGWTYNGWTGKHRMFFPLLCNTVTELESAFDYFDQVLNKSLFQDAAIEKERGAILDEIRRSDSDADKYIAKTRLKLIFPDNVLQYAVLGDASSVTSITRDDLLKQRYLLLEARRCIVSIGHCSIEDVAQASRTFVHSLSQQKSHDPILYRDITKVDTVATVPFKKSSVDILSLIHI
jgi:Zn-dependent M16 (insulinase) family peptidase